MVATIFTILYIILTLIYIQRLYPSIFWEVTSYTYIVLTFFTHMPWIIWLFFGVIIAAISITLRSSMVKEYISIYLFNFAKKNMVKLSRTEEEALNSGDTWIEQDIFRGELSFEKINSITTQLTQEEQEFINNETEELCKMLNVWDIHLHNDLPKKVWEHIKSKGFFGLVIDKKYGGKGFSARAHSDIILKIASRSVSAAVTVMVPNSLGPGELLQHYGTEKQKSKYLPKLASGEEIPCFALTEPNAGSDATAIESEAIVIEQKINGKKTLALMLNIEKRWITLAPIATLIGLAVNLKDPDKLLNGVGAEGITCILMPRDTKGLEIGKRHNPSFQNFMNGPIRGKNIIVPIDTIIGGQEQAGNGWHMLVECLAIGRSISLPALSNAATYVSYLSSSAYSKVRRQFKLDIAKFEGIEEKLAEIAGLTYLAAATRLLTVAAVDAAKKPSVASAITKYTTTEFSRIAINNAMDIHAGRAVMTGPRNYLTDYYIALPISITVEGANIMTRNLLIFGQGLMACHPFIRNEFYALSKNDKLAFKNHLWNHIGYFLKNLANTILSAWSFGKCTKPDANNLVKEHQQLLRLSYAYAWLADFAIIVLGGTLKRSERLSARLADVLSYLYMATAALKLCHEQKYTESAKAHARWACNYCFAKTEEAFVNFCKNFPNKFLGQLAKIIILPFGARTQKTQDLNDKKLTQYMTQNNDIRDYFKQLIFLSNDPNQPLDRIEHAFELSMQKQSPQKTKELEEILRKTLLDAVLVDEF